MTRTEPRYRSLAEHQDGPGEVGYRIGQAFRKARTQVGLSRQDVKEKLEDSSRVPVEFEHGNREISKELWMAYVRALKDQVSVPQFRLQEASSLMRGLVNQIRLYLGSRS